jgi:hypothetical protein
MHLPQPGHYDDLFPKWEEECSCIVNAIASDA